MTRGPLLFAVLALAACSELPQRVYENVRTIRDSRRTPAERAVAPSPTYEEYKQEIEGKPTK